MGFRMRTAGVVRSRGRLRDLGLVFKEGGGLSDHFALQAT